MIKTYELTKKYGKQHAVRDLSINIQEGEIYGFLGPNGAGKTTTIRMILGLTKPTSGSMQVFGEDIQPGDYSFKQHIGVVPEKHPRGMWRWMTAGEYLQLFCSMFSIRQADEVISSALERLQLSEHRNKRIMDFSRGMLQKLSFARATMHDPKLLLLDEPISGLDPIGIRQIRDFILEEHRKGKTIIISSHLLTEIERFCTRIGIIKNGSLVTESSTAEIIDLLIQDRTYRIDIEEIPPNLSNMVKTLPFVLHVETEGTVLFVTVDKESDHRKQLSQFLYEQGSPPLSIQEKTRSLEDAFISVTSSSLEADSARVSPRSTP